MTRRKGNIVLMSTRPSINSIVSVSREQVSSELAGEVVIMNLRRGVYHGLEATGARVWQLIQEPRKVSEIRDALLAEYDVEARQP